MLRRSKLPIVKAKVGPRVMSFICDAAIFDTVPIKKEVKAVISGLYITSGIINTKEEEVREALIANGFEILGVEYMKEWCCFIAK